MAKFRDPKVRIASSYASTRRTLRRPQHPFQLRTRPFQIQPFCLAPVLPGETLKNALVQSRVVTDPIKHALLGWWTEYYLFYVKHQDIAFHLGDNFHEKIMLDPTWDGGAMHTAANPKHYHAYGINFSQLCLETVSEYYFRDQGEDWDKATLDGLPLAQITGKSWLDSMTLDAEKRTDRDVSLDLNQDGDITVSEMIEAQQHYNALREAGLEDMDYEDFIRTYGVKIPEVPTSTAVHRPELLRYSREWTYPTNTVDPATGVPSSACSWAVAFRADKDRFFKEPGFVFGVTVTRPKAYIKDQKGMLAGSMDSPYAWLPAVLQNQYEKGFIQFDQGEGPIGDQIPADGYWVDIRDLFTYGDQFMNFVPDDQAGALEVLGADGSKRYPDATTIDALFRSPETAKQIRQDGIVTLAIAGRQRDRTPGVTL